MVPAKDVIDSFFGIDTLEWYAVIVQQATRTNEIKFKVSVIKNAPVEYSAVRSFKRAT